MIYTQLIEKLETAYSITVVDTIIETLKTEVSSFKIDIDKLSEYQYDINIYKSILCIKIKFDKIRYLNVYISISKIIEDIINK